MHGTNDNRRESFRKGWIFTFSCIKNGKCWRNCTGEDLADVSVLYGRRKLSKTDGRMSDNKKRDRRHAHPLLKYLPGQSDPGARWMMNEGVTRQICVFYAVVVLFCFFFTSAKDLHNSALTVLRANKSERRQFGGGSKDPRGWFTAARLAAVQGSSHQRSLDPSSSRHKLSSKPLFFFFYIYTNNNPKSQTHLSTRQRRCRRLVLTFTRDALLFSKRMNLGWGRSGGGGRGQVFCICNYQIGSGGYVQLFAENHLSDDFDATCSHPIGGQSPALCFWGCFLVQTTSLSLSQMSQKTAQSCRSLSSH